MSALSERAAQTSLIKAPAMNITLGSAGVLSLAAVLTAWKEAFDFIFGADKPVSDTIRKDLLIATIAAIVVVAAADMIARAVAARGDPTHIMPWAKGWKATWTGAEPHESGYLLAGMRVRASNPDEVEYLLVNGDKGPAWHRASDVVLQPPS
jgi:hypothetical protein